VKQHQKRCYNITKITISLQKDYNYNQIDGYFAWCGFKSRRGKNKNLTVLKSNSNTIWFNFQTYIYIYSQTCIKRSPLGHRKSDEENQ
jgi:hypothetical protein